MSKTRKSPATNRLAKSSQTTAAVSGPALGLSRWLAPSLIVAAFYPGIFILPYHVAAIGPSGSQSWEFGFHNTVAQESIALMLLSLFAWRMLFSKADLQASPLAKVLLGKSTRDSTRSLWLTMGIFQLISFAVLITWYNILPYTHYGEFTYFIQRLEIMIEGRMPLRDFDFDYGTGMLAVPMFFYNIGHGRVSIEEAYFAALLLHFAIGYALLAYIISQLNPQRGKTLIYALVAFPWFNLTMGLNYTPLRFTIALASLFAVRQASLIATGSRLRWCLLTLAALFLPFLNFLISPEMGLALTVTLLAYFGWFLFGPHRRYAALILPLVVGMVFIYWVFPSAYFNSMFSFGKGGASFPIFPTIHILGFMAAAIWVFPQLGIMAIRDKTVAAPFCAGLAILLGLLILPATGRCDAGHIYINSMGLFILTLASLTWLTPKWTSGLLVVYTLIFPVMELVVFCVNYQEPMHNALEARRQLSHLTYTSDNYFGRSSQSSAPTIHYSKLLPMGDWLKELPETKIGIPLGVDETTERFLHLTGRLAPEYHIAPYFDIFGPPDLARKYADMRGMEYILIPREYLGYLQPVNVRAQMRAQAAADSKWMSGLLLFPIDLPGVNPMFQPKSDIMRQIAGEYEVAKQYPNMLLLKRKPQ